MGPARELETGIAHITTRKDLKRAPGAAFAVAVRNGNAYLVTSAHVVEGDDSPQVEFVAEPEKVYRATVRVIEAGDERGLALLVVANPPAGVRPIPASSLLLGIQAGVSVAGYPSSLNTFSVVDTTVAALRGRDVFLSRETDEGFSGGPVVIAGGVVGIVYRHEAGFGKVLGASSINPFIEGNSLAWGTFGTPKRPPDLTQLPLLPKIPRPDRAKPVRTLKTSSHTCGYRRESSPWAAHRKTANALCTESRPTKSLSRVDSGWGELK